MNEIMPNTPDIIKFIIVLILATMSFASSLKNIFDEKHNSYIDGAFKLILFIISMMYILMYITENIKLW